jgi:hypothetical protein
MSKSLFVTLSDIVDELEHCIRELDSSPYRDRLEDIVRRLDSVIDRTVGITEEADVSTTREPDAR